MTNPSPAPETFRGATSVSITVKDMHKSLAWYQHVVGFGVERSVERDGRPVFVALKAGDVRLSLNQDDGAKGWDRIKGLGFSINIWTTEDVDAIAIGNWMRGCRTPARLLRSCRAGSILRPLTTGPPTRRRRHAEWHL